MSFLFICFILLLMEAMPLILCMTGLVSNFILYSVLKKKYNFEINVFLYSVGFTSCCAALLCFTQGILSIFRVGSETNLWPYYLLPFIFLYYSYATLLQNDGKEISRVTLCLAATAFIPFAALIIFEVIECWIPWMGIFPSLFGLYLAYCLIHKKGLLNLQRFTWSPFIPSGVAFWCFVISAIFNFSF